MFTPLDQFDIYSLYFLNLWLAYDLSITNIIIPIIIIIYVLRKICLKSYILINKILPNSIIQQIIEVIIVFIFNILKTNIGKSAYINIHLWLTVFLVVLLGNLLSLIPFGIALTSHIIIILWMSLGITFSIFIRGTFFSFPLTYLKIFVPNSPLILIPLLVSIELFSYVIRSFSLAIRLSANILAGHTLMYIIMGLFNFVINYSIIFSFLTVILLLCVYILELFVAILQAYVYISLLLYICVIHIFYLHINKY